MVFSSVVLLALQNHFVEESMVILILVILFSVLPAGPILAQCSDAGACSIGGSQPEAESSEKTLSLSLRYSFGSSGADDDLRFHGIHAEGMYRIGTSSSLHVALPWTDISGPQGKASGIGDLLVFWDQRLWQFSSGSIRGQLGGRIASGTVTSGALPQAYQPGLGTNDLLVGLTFDLFPWHAGLAWQYSRERSANPVTRLRRGDDVLLRTGYTQRLSVFTLGLEALAIKRLSEASILDRQTVEAERFIAIPDSDQLQINIAGRAEAPLSNSMHVLFFAAVPLLKRTTNVDGLTRALTLSTGLRIEL
jgi:hypothetical protein